MKKHYFLFFTFLALYSSRLHAQGTIQCGIFFGHDAVGNRVKRLYDCRTLGQTWTDPGSTVRLAPPNSEIATMDEGSGKESTIVVYPNPTSGVFTIKLNEVPKETLHFHWYNDQLQILGSGHISDISYSGNIAGWADGVYILRVYDREKVHSFKIVKVTSAGQ